MSGLTRLGARLLRATITVDRAYERYCRARSLLVTAIASDRVLGAYNDLAHGATRVYDAGSATFRETLFNWEEEMIGQVFPAPPCRVLIGGAGGGREAFQLEGRGYDVVAFEPSVALVRSMAHRAAQRRARVEALVGRYEEMPVMRPVAGAPAVDLREAGPFDVALMGWTSYSHLRRSSSRSGALRAMASVTDGPVVASFYPRPSRPAENGIRGFLNTLGRRSNGDAFTPYVGYYHSSSEEEVLHEVQTAGLTIIAQCWEHTDGHWPWIAVARPQISARVAAAMPLSG